MDKGQILFSNEAYFIVYTVKTVYIIDPLSSVRQKALRMGYQKFQWSMWNQGMVETFLKKQPPPLSKIKKENK